MLKEFICAVRILAMAGRWDLLAVFFEIIRELRTPDSATRLDVRVGEPQDKEV